MENMHHKIFLQVGFGKLKIHIVILRANTKCSTKREVTVFSTNDAGKNVYPYGKIMTVNP